MVNKSFLSTYPERRLPSGGLFRNLMNSFWPVYPRGLVILSLFLASTLPTCADSIPPYSAVAPGLDYANVHDTNQPWSIHITRLDRSHAEFEILSTLAQGKVQGLSTLVQQVKSLPGSVGTPMAAVNGDFFVIAKGPYQGDPLGLQILQGELVSAPAGPSFWIEPQGKLHLEKISSQFTASLPHGAKIPFGLNQERKTNSAVLFTPTFGASTRTTNGWEMVLESVDHKSWLPLRADKTYPGRVRAIRPAGDTPLGPDIAILSVDPGLTNRFAAVLPGTILTLSTSTSRDVSKAANAIGGAPLLVVHGTEQQWPAKKGTNTVPLPRQPRTAIGWNPRYFYLVVVDGRQKELSMGMTFPELAHFMKDLGCTEALNLDGGGSTTFWLQDKVMNSPSDQHERSLANALVIVQHPVPHAATHGRTAKASN
jgi:hypothetical protein